MSTVIAAFNSSDWIRQTLRSVLTQTLVDIEVIVVDDGSVDSTVSVVRALAENDHRIKVIELPSNLGAAAARNRGLQCAKGKWIAIVDSDDIITPDRLERLVTAAENHDVDIACDNILSFYEDEPFRQDVMLRDLDGPVDVDVYSYVKYNSMRHRAPSYGYLQPLLRADTVRRLEVRYCENLLVAEDYDFILRLLVRGARMRIYPWPTYLYRRRSLSLSHRLTTDHLRRMLQADSAFQSANRTLGPAISKALDDRRTAIVRLLEMSAFVESLKNRNFSGAARLLIGHPSIIADLRHPMADRWKRFWARHTSML